LRLKLKLNRKPKSNKKLKLNLLPR